MERREYVALFGSAAIGATAGCATVGGSEQLTEPTLQSDDDTRRHLKWSTDGEEVATLSVDGDIWSDLIRNRASIWHRESTHLESISLRIWMPGAEPGHAPEISLVGPVQGDSSPPPAISLSVTRGQPGTTIKIDDFDDLKNETVTVEFYARPRSETGTTLAFDGTIELAETDLLGADYTLEGDLELAFPEIENMDS